MIFVRLTTKKLEFLINNEKQNQSPEQFLIDLEDRLEQGDLDITEVSNIIQDYNKRSK